VESFLLKREYSMTKRCLFIFACFILSFSLYSESQTHYYDGSPYPCIHITIGYCGGCKTDPCDCPETFCNPGCIDPGCYSSCPTTCAGHKYCPGHINCTGHPAYCPGHVNDPGHSAGCSGFEQIPETISLDPESGTIQPETVTAYADDIDQDLALLLQGDEDELTGGKIFVKNMDGPDGAVESGENKEGAVEEKVVTDKNEVKAQGTGDPVKIAIGEFYTSETDVSLGVGELYLDISRRYGNQRMPSKGVFGNLWESSLDDRIIRAAMVDSTTILQVYKNKVVAAEAKYLEMLEDYEDTISNIEAGIDGLDVKIAYCNTAILAFTAARDKASHTKSAYTSQITAYDGYRTIITGIRDGLIIKKNNYETVVKAAAIENARSFIDGDLSNQLADIQKKHDAAEAFRSLNSKVADSNNYIKTGNGKIILIDEKGIPQIFSISANIDYDSTSYYGSSGIKNYYPQGSELTCSKNIDYSLTLSPDGEYIKTLKDGSIKIYNLYGLPKRFEDRNGHGFDYEYANTGQLESLVIDDGRRINFTYSNGFISGINLPEDRSLLYTYEGAKLFSAQDAEGAVVGYRYDGNLLRRIIKPDYSFREYIYEYNSDISEYVMVKGVDEEGSLEIFSYDFPNRRGTYSGPQGLSMHYYNESHQEIRVENSDGSIVVSEFDSAGNLIYRNDANGDIHYYEYDALNQMTLQSENSIILKEWDYGGDGFLDKYTEYSAGESYIVEYGRDLQKRNISETRRNFLSPGSISVRTYTYNVITGLLETKRNADGHMVHYGYDRNGFLSSVTETVSTNSENGIESRLYNYQFLNDDFGNVVNEKKLEDGHILSHKSFLWNKDGKLEEVYDEIERIPLDKREYNNRKDLIRRTDSTGGLWIYDYDKRHKLLNLLNPIGEKESYQYDPLARLRGKELYDRNSILRSSISYRYNNSGRLLSSEQIETGKIKEYTYYPGGRLLSETVYIKDHPLLKSQKVYEYDLSPPDITGMNNSGFVTTVKITEDDLLESWYLYEAGSNRLSAKITGAGRFTEYEYNGFGAQTEQRGFGGNRSYSYDSEGILIREKKNGIETRIKRDEKGRVSNVSDDKNLILQTYGYDISDKSVYFRNSLGGEEYNSYDSRGRLVEHSYSDGSTENWKYPDNFYSVYSDLEGFEWGIIKDPLNRVIKSRDPKGAETSYSYDIFGNMTGSVDPTGLVNRNSYNQLGQLSEVIKPSGATVSYTYDMRGRIISKSDEFGTITRWDYEYIERDGQVYTRKKEQVNGETIIIYEFDADGFLVCEESPDGSSYEWHYNNEGQMISESDWFNEEKEFLYENHRIKERLDFNGQRTFFEYDNRGRLISVSDGSGILNSFTYNSLGRLTDVGSGSGRQTYEYNNRGIMTGRRDVETDLDITYSYDSSGRVLKQNWSDGDRISFKYNSTGRLSELTDYLDQTTYYDYDSAGRQIEIRYANGISRRKTWNSSGTIKTDLCYLGEGSAAQLMSGRAFGYDRALRKIIEVATDGKIITYEYDDKGRLATSYRSVTNELMKSGFDKRKDLNLIQKSADFSIEKNKILLRLNRYSDLSHEQRELINDTWQNIDDRGIAAPDTFTALWKEIYTYDVNGNSASLQNPWGAILYQYEGRSPHQLTQAGEKAYEYDKNGNLISTVTGSKQESFSYNIQNRMVEYRTESDNNQILENYYYDGLGRRHSRLRIDRSDTGNSKGFTETWQYDGLTFTPVMRIVEDGIGETFKSLLNPGGTRHRILTPNDISIDTNRSLTRKYVSANSVIVSSFSHGEERNYSRSTGLKASGSIAGIETIYMVTDIQGSIRSCYRGDGTLESSYTYNSYGEVITGDLGENQMFGYNGKPYDCDSKTYNYGFRDYSPEVMRFTTVDPIKDGKNWYSYVGNDPINFIDPNGLWTQSMGAAVYNNLNQPYISGVNDCDIWVENTEKEAHPSSTLSKIVGLANTTNAANHKIKLEDEDLLSNDLELGTNYAVQGKKHIMLVSLNPDGTVNIAQQTKNPENKEKKKEEGFKGGFSETFSYESEQEFKNDNWGELNFYALGDGDVFKDGVYDPDKKRACND